MSVKKKTLSFPEEVWSVIEDGARVADMTPSAYVSELVLRNDRNRRGLQAVAEYEAEYGAFTEDELAWADKVLDTALDPAEPKPSKPS